MKSLLVCEVREGKLRESFGELLAFAEAIRRRAGAAPDRRRGARARRRGQALGRPAVAARRVRPSLAQGGRDRGGAPLRRGPDVVFVHSSWGWDVAPRVAAALGAAQVSDVVGVDEGGLEVGCCNGKMRRVVAPRTAQAVITIQPGAFPPRGERSGAPVIERLAPPAQADGMAFLGYEAAAPRGVDLAHAQVIVSAGRGVGKKENVEIVAALAKALGGELGASRPVVDAGWVDHGRQVGTTGQTVAPKLYVACGISGAIQHLAGMKRAEFVVAINKDRDAPIGEVANVLAVGDLVQLLPAITARLQR